MADSRAKLLVAYHEVGHALCSTLTPGHDAVRAVTIMPRGRAKGLTWFVPDEEATAGVTRQQLFAGLVGALGGRAAEDVVFGEPEVTSAAAGDLVEVKRTATAMVTRFGMGPLGPWAPWDGGGEDAVMRLLTRSQQSEQLLSNVDAAVKALADEAYAAARACVQNHREAADALVEELLEVETMSGDRFRQLLRRFVPQLPCDAPAPAAAVAQTAR